MIKPNWEQPKTVSAIASTREGGFSAGPYQGLNLGNHVGDDPILVEKNRQWLVQGGYLPNTPVWLNQTHSTEVVCVNEWTSEILDADGIFTTTPGLVCAIMTADCLPVLMTNKAGTEVAAVHAGWRGLADGILQNALNCFSNPSDVIAWVGPAISQHYFEVGEEVVKHFVALDANSIVAFEPKVNAEGKWMGDLPLIAKQQLIRAGVADVTLSDLCTYQKDQQFYSYRRDGQTGRQASFIWINA